MSFHRYSSALIAAMLLAGTSASFAAPPAYITLDHSSDALMSDAKAKELWKDKLSLRLAKLYPVGKWGFVTEVEGGFDDNKVCVVTARAMLMPRSGKSLVFKPAKTATAFGSQASASPEQCRALAQGKLGDAMDAIHAALLPR